MSKRIGSPTESIIEDLNQGQQFDEILYSPLMQEIDSLAKSILLFVEKSQNEKRTENIVYEKLAENILAYSVRLIYSVKTNTIEEARFISGLSSSLLDDLRGKELPNNCKQDLQKNIVLIQAIAQGIVNDKKNPEELKSSLSFVKELLVITENNKPSQGTASIVDVPIVMLESKEYAEYERLNKRHQLLKNFKTLCQTRNTLTGEDFLQDQFEQNVLQLIGLYQEYSEGSSIELLYQLLGADKEVAPKIFEQLLAISSTQIQVLNPNYEIGEYRIEIAVSPRHDDAPEIVDIEILDELTMEFFTPAKNNDAEKKDRVARVLDFDAPDTNFDEEKEAKIRRVLDFDTPIKKKVQTEININDLDINDLDFLISGIKKEKLPIDWLGEVEDLVMEYRVIQNEVVKKSINDRLTKFLEALEKLMFIDAYFKASIQALIYYEDDRFLRKWQKLLVPTLHKYADKAALCSQQNMLNQISEKDQKRLEGILEGFSGILQMVEKCQKIDEETIQTLKIMMEVVIEQFDTTNPREKQFKHWLNNSMALEKFWLRFKSELVKIQDEVKRLLPNYQSPEPKAQEPHWAERIDE